ncbi:neuromedin U [Pseudomonadota bacterium]
MRILLVAAFAGLWMATALAQEQSDRVWVLPFEVDSDFGADNGNAIITRAIPVNSLLVREDWKLINLAMITIADAPGGRPGSPGNPESVAGPRTFGVGDLTDAVLFTWNTRGKLMWGAGAAFNLPIATDETLGSGKWQAGPAIRLGYQALNWRFGLLATNRWSFAGDSDRADVNQLLLRTVIRRKLRNRWFFISDPIITANWNADSGQKWLVPLGGGFGRALSTDPVPVNVSLQFYWNAVRPDGAPDWLVRVGVTFPFQIPD